MPPHPTGADARPPGRDVSLSPYPDLARSIVSRRASDFLRRSTAKVAKAARAGMVWFVPPRRPIARSVRPAPNRVRTLFGSPKSLRRGLGSGCIGAGPSLFLRRQFVVGQGPVKLQRHVVERLASVVGRGLFLQQRE